MSPSRLRCAKRPPAFAVLSLSGLVALVAGCATASKGESYTDKVKFDLVSALPDGGRVPRKTVVEAEISYSIRGFSPGRFFVQPQFETEEGRAIDPAAGEVRDLERAEGRLKVRVPLDRRLPAGRVRGPLSMWLCLTQRVAGRSTLLARVGPLHYDLP
jgi:hypothetical protein